MFRNLLFTAKRQIHVVSTNIIKPSSPTHSSLKHYKLSPLDQFSTKNYIPVVFYYPNNVFPHIQDIVRRLKCSLSETLVQYYPFAGRLNSRTFVDCNDEGVEFQEVNIKRQMSEILDTSDHEEESLGLVFPDGLIWGNVNKNSPLLVVRLANFECGGSSIAVCMSHKLGDAKSFYTFMTSWATKTRQMNSSSSNEDIQDHSPHFISNPSTDDANIVPELPLSKNDRVTRRFLFPNSKLTKLKEIVAHKSGIENITKFEVLTALLHKCAITANTTNSGFFTPSVLPHPVNMRHKMLPPLPETLIGNLYCLMNIEIKNENENNLSALVKKIKKAKMGIGGMKTLDAMLNFSSLERFAQNNYDFFGCSSLCKMKFYQVDFGWGNPSRVAIADTMLDNNFIFMDTPNGDGIEALVALNQQNMTAFQEDKDILHFSLRTTVDRKNEERYQPMMEMLARAQSS